jgi:hypothetical protein
MLLDTYISFNLMLIYGSYMKGIGLKWIHLFFWYTLFCFDLVMIKK